MSYETILYEVKNHIAYITLNRPQVMNAISLQMSREIIDACEQVRKDSEIRVCILTGAGEKAFCTGLDLKERAKQVEESSFFAKRRARNEPGIHSHHQAVAAIDKPTIAAIRGYAVGGGLEMALLRHASGGRGREAWHDGGPSRAPRRCRRNSTSAPSHRNC